MKDEAAVIAGICDGIDIAIGTYSLNSRHSGWMSICFLKTHSVTNKMDIFSIVSVYINDILDLNKDLLPVEAREAVLRYLNSAEYEMSFEGLFLDLMDIGRFRSNYDLEYCLEIGMGLNLNNVSVFNDDFWSLFVNFINSLAVDGDEKPFLFHGL